jgi:hypothetical protein
MLLIGGVGPMLGQIGYFVRFTGKDIGNPLTRLTNAAVANAVREKGIPRASADLFPLRQPLPARSTPAIAIRPPPLL